MAQAQPEQFLNVIALAIIILPFLTTEAVDRIDQWDDYGWQAYLKVGTLLSLFLAFSITVFVANTIFTVAGQVYPGFRITAAYFLFIALYLPTLGLLIPSIAKWGNLVFDSELDNRKLGGVILTVLLIALLVTKVSPVS